MHGHSKFVDFIYFVFYFMYFHILFKSFSNIEKISVKTLTKLFSSMVLPILLYNCEIWGPYLIGKEIRLTRSKTKFLKYIIMPKNYT